MVLTSVSGHLLNFEFTDQTSKNWQNYPIGALFEAPVEKICNPDMANIKRTLENEAKKAEHLVIWTDCDREGENIGIRSTYLFTHVLEWNHQIKYLGTYIIPIYLHNY